MNRTTVLLAAATFAAIFGAWSLFVASRYQALCELSYFSASKEELKLCDQRMSELKQGQ
jgi:hypothetical protein